MQLVRCGTRKLETDLCQNAQNVIAGTRLAFCHQETDFLIIYNESDVILFSRQQQGLIKKQIHTMNLPKNISFPMMIYQSNILFCMCLSDNNECLLLIKNLNDENGLCQPWKKKWLIKDCDGNRLVHKQNINVNAFTLCIANDKVIDTNKIDFFGIFYDKFSGCHHVYEQFNIQNLERNIFNDEDNYGNMSNHEANDYQSLEEGYKINEYYQSFEEARLLNIEQLNSYLYFRGGSKRIYKISKGDNAHITQITYPDFPHDDNWLSNDNDFPHDDNNDFPQKKQNCNTMQLWDQYKHGIFFDSNQYKDDEFDLYERPLNKDNTKIIAIETSCGIILIEIDLFYGIFLLSIVVNNEHDNILFHSHYEFDAKNSVTVQYAWKSGEYIKFIYCPGNFHCINKIFIWKISIYDLIPNCLLWKLQKIHFVLLQNMLSVNYSFPRELIDLLCEYLNPVM